MVTNAPELEPHVRDLIAAGDLDGAATEALRALGPSVLRYLRSMLRDEEAAVDAFSHFAENLWKGLASFRGDSSLRTWAFRLAYNAALNLRDEAWRRRARPFATGEASRIAEEVRTKTVVRVERQRRALDTLREALTEDERSLLALRIDQGLSWAEIAVVISAEGSPVDANTLTKRFERLKERLAAMAREQGLLD
jgi:RNA polymerase sigma-70 factor (ECF subfamily)